MSECVRIGDIVTLRNIKIKNYLCAEGILSDEIVVGKMDSFDDNWFQICLPRQYSASSELQELMEIQKLEEANGFPVDDAGIRHLEALRLGAKNEQKMNELYMKTKFGNEVHYGDSIQLLHVKSRKYVTVVGNQVAEHERENIRVCLHPQGTSDSWMVIQPRFKINQSGDVVLSNSEIKLNIAERPNEFLHSTDKGYSRGHREVNASLEPTSWFLSIFQSTTHSEDPNVILTSELVSLVDPETQSSLSLFQRPAIITNRGIEDDEISEDDSIMELSEDGEIVMELSDKNIASSALWLLESKQIISGGPIQWKTDQVRFKHINTGKYMCMKREGDSDGEYVLTVANSPMDKGTLFSVQELHSTGNFLQDKRAVQISHSSAYLERGELREVAGFTNYKCSATRNKSNAVYLFISRYSDQDPSDTEDSESKQPMDVFVGNSIRNMMKSYLDAVKNFDEYDPNDEDNEEFIDRIWPDLDIADDKRFYKVVEKMINYLKGNSISDTPPANPDEQDDDAVNEFGEIIRNDAVIGRRQKMFREQGTIDIVLFLLNSLLPLFKGKLSGDVDTDQVQEFGRSNTRNMREAVAAEPELEMRKKLLHRMAAKVSESLLRLLLQAVKRNSANQLYVASHMHVVLGWVGVQQIAADVVREMLNDNLELQTERVGPNEIKIFTNQLTSPEAKMKSMYFTMLKAFCSCSGHGISRNQGFVMDAVLPIAPMIFVKLAQSSTTDVAQTREFFANSLYIPEKVPHECAPLGYKALSDGLPYLSVTWATLDEKFSTESLFGKEVIPLSELFRSAKIGPRSNNNLPGAVAGVAGAKSSKPPLLIKRSLSAGVLDMSKMRSNSSPVQSDKKLAPRNMTQERKKAVVQYFVAQLYLLSEMCLDRNVSAISKIETLIPYEYLITILSAQTLSAVSSKGSNISDLYGATASLITTLYVDRESETTRRVPCLSKMWSSLQSEEGTIASVDEKREHRFGLLQHILSSHIKSMRADGGKWETHSLYMVSVLKKLVTLQFYGTIEKLQDVIVPLMTVLNRRNPEIDNKSSSASARIGSSNSLDMAKLVAMVPTWQKSALSFMESVTELALVMVLVLVSTAVALVQVIYNYSGTPWFVFDLVVGFIFFAEVSFRGYVHYNVRHKWSTFFGDHFVQLDIAVVLLDVIVMASEDALGSFGSFSGILRALRMLRLVRVVRAARLLKQLPKEDDEEVRKWALPARYRTAPAYELSTMVAMVDVLRDVQKILDDRNLTILLHGFSKWAAEATNSPADAARAADAFSRICESTNELRISNDEYDDTLLDLLMYVEPALVQSVLDLLMAHHSSIEVMMENARQVQMLVSPSREKQFRLTTDLLLELDRNIETFALWGGVRTEEDRSISARSETILNTLRDNCRVRRKVLKFDHDYEPDVHMQNLLRNFGCWEVCLKLLKKLDLSANEEANAAKSTISIMTACNDLLYWYAYDNTTNQDEMYEELEFFMSTVDNGIGSHHVIAAIFSNNEPLMRRVPMHYIAEFTEKICKNGRFPQYLTLLSSVTAIGEKNILENQYEIVKQISSPNRQKKILCFFCPTSHFEYSKKLKLMAPYQHRRNLSPDDIAAELAYHVELLKALAGCTIGYYNITTIETKVQAMFNYVDIIDAILDPKCLLFIKIRTGLFLYNAILEVEMLIPGLVYSPKIWTLLQHCVEVLSTGKDALRMVERNGWDCPGSSRQGVEYIVVCAMIVYGFFKVYYDPVVFRREHTATYGTQASTLQISMLQIDGIITSLFDVLKGIYDLDSPILSTKHKTYIYGALDSLSKAKGIVLSDFVQVTHIDVAKSEVALAIAELETPDYQERKLSSKLSTFLDYLSKEDSVQETLNDEFQAIISKITALPLAGDRTSTSTVRREPLLKKLVDHIRGAVEVVTHSSGREKNLSERYTKTAVWVIKLFRTMIENVWGMTIYERDDDGGEEQDIACEDIVKTFNACGATTLCLDLISPGIDRELILECVKLGVAMLFKEGGALQVQQTMYNHLSTGDSEFFFLQLRKIIAELMSWHDWNGVITLKDDEEPDLPPEIISVRFMQLMCEGHYGPNQDIMREQPGKIVSINLLDDMVAYLVSLGRIPCKTSTAAALAVGATVLEVIQGPCEGNQDHFALNTSLIETLNHQMRARVTGDCDVGKELELKKTGIDIFQALLEGQGQKLAVYERVLSVIHLDVIQLMCAPAESSEDDAEKDEEAEEIELVLRTESLVLLQMLCDFKPSLRNELDIMKNSDNTMGSSSVASVEIMWRGELQRRFYNVPTLCKQFTDNAKSKFVEFVDRSSQENKILDMYTRAKVIYTDLLHQQSLEEVGVNKIFSQQNQNRATWVTFLICCTINFLLIMFYDGSECFEGYSEEEETEVVCGKPTLPSNIRSAVNVLNTFQIVFSSFTLVLFLIVRAPVKYITAMKQGKGVLRSLVATALEPLTLYYFVYVILAAGSISVDHILTLLLLDIIVKNSYAMDVIIAVFTPIKQLAMACLLCVIVMYIFAMVLFLEYNSAGALAFPDDCSSLYKCFKFSVGYGRSGDFNADMHQRINNQWYFSMAFDIAIRFVLLNVIRGITVDTFSELRLAKIDRLRDTTETCFICGINKQVFDRDKASKGFKYHIKTEHNMWNYLFFILYIWEQDKDDDDGLEQYVRRCIDANDISWVPTNKAMCLNLVTEDKEGETRESFMKDIRSMEMNFLNLLAQLQTEVNSKVYQVKKYLMKKSGQEVTPVVPFQMPEQQRAVTCPPSISKPQVAVVKKSSTMSLIDEGPSISMGITLSIEIAEIIGLTFPSRTLDSISCVVRSPLGTVQIENSHVMFHDHSPSLVLFDPIEIIVCEQFNELSQSDDVVVIQIARGSPLRFVGVVHITLGDIAASFEQRIEKSFHAEVGSSVCRGTLVVNTNKREPMPFQM